MTRLSREVRRRLLWQGPARRSRHETKTASVRAWRGEPFAHEGERYSFPELSCLPPPVQRPHPGLWLASGQDWPSGAVPEQTGWLAQAGVAADPVGVGSKPGVDGRGIALICPVSASGDWAPEIAAWRERFEPDWLLVWPEAGSGDEARAAQTQRLFAESIEDFSA